MIKPSCIKIEKERNELRLIDTNIFSLQASKLVDVLLYSFHFMIRIRAITLSLKL